MFGCENTILLVRWLNIKGEWYIQLHTEKKISGREIKLREVWSKQGDRETISQRAKQRKKGALKT